MRYSLLPTPCPAPRQEAAGRHVGSLFDRTETLQAVPEYTCTLTDLPKPRRPVNRRSKIDWDPTTDILADETNVTEDAPRLNISRAARRSSLLAPPQRIPLTGRMADTQSKRRRIHSVPEEDAADVTVARLQAPSLQDPARRRKTIYVPSDDTTVSTIHPGLASSGAAQLTPGTMSDIFLQIANNDGSPVQPRVQTQRMKSLRRTSLAADPRRPALQTATRPLQCQASTKDRNGTGPGKENIAPGNGEKLHTKSTQSPKLLQKPSSNAAGHLVERSPRTARGLSDDSPSSISKSNTLINRPPRRQSLAASSINPAPSLKTEVVEKKSLANSAASHRRSLNVQLPKHRGVSPQFPRIEEDIEFPALYEDEEQWIKRQEIALAQIINMFIAPETDPGVVPCDGRQNMLQLFQTHENVLLQKRLNASLQFGALAISEASMREVMRLEHDQAHKKRFLNTFIKTYQPKALKAALEAVTGYQARLPSGQVPAMSPNKLVAMFFTKHFIGHADDACTSEGNSHMATRWRSTVLRSLNLVRLLDMAKTAGAVDGCLFLKDSTCKSSQAVLSAVLKLLLPSAGDAARTLGHFDYHVQHCQTQLDEIEWRVDNVAVDLRDGVRLWRLTETLPHWNTQQAGREALQLHYPCASRAQRMANMGAVFERLGRLAEFRAVADRVRAEDIVDGHRERTVEVLWLVLSKWGLPGLVERRLVLAEIRRLGGAQCAGTSEAASEETLLRQWARAVSESRGVACANFSSALADGRVFASIVREYAATASSSSAQSATTALRQLGCSESFAGLFAGTEQRVAHCARTATPMLGFLASRLLPSAVPRIAATTIQRSWRRHRARRRRAVLDSAGGQDTRQCQS